jgi:hypothetical protein
MRVSLKLCTGCQEMRPIWKNHEGEKYCKDCWYKKQSVLTHTKKPSKVSKHLQLDNEVYRKLRSTFLQQDSRRCCEGNLSHCTRCDNTRLTIHHSKGRGKYLLDTSSWVVLCITCHRWVEDHPHDAYEMGFSQLRNT